LIAFDARLSKEAVRVDLGPDDYWSRERSKSDWIRQAFLGTKVTREAVARARAAYRGKTGQEIEKTEVYHLFELTAGDGGRFVRTAQDAWVDKIPFKDALDHYRVVAVATGYPVGHPRITLSSPGYLVVGPQTGRAEIYACNGFGVLKDGVVNSTIDQIWTEFRKFPKFPVRVQQIYDQMHLDG